MKKSNFNKHYIGSIILFAVSLASMVIVTELLFLLFPALIPQNILLKMPVQRAAKVLGNNPEKTIVKLEENPWLKFQPNVPVYDYRRTGEVASFVSSRQTDALGFKNVPGIARLGKADVLLLGSSHVEGMGVADKETIAGVLNADHSITAYSLGVQGYGPQQYLGALKKFGIAFRPKYVFFSTNAFRLALKLHNGELSGRMIRWFKAKEKILEKARIHMNWRFLYAIRDNSFFIAGLRLIKDLTMGGDIQKVKDVSVSGKNPDITTIAELRRFAADRFGRYLRTSYFDFSDAGTRDKLNRTMEIYQAVLLDGKRTGEKYGFQFVVLMLPSEPMMLQVAFPDGIAGRSRDTYVEYQAWRRERITQFCRDNAIPVVDATASVSDYLFRNFVDVPLDRQIDLNELPFFKIDGHPTRVAHSLYAESIKKFIGQQTPQGAQP